MLYDVRWGNVGKIHWQIRIVVVNVAVKCNINIGIKPRKINVDANACNATPIMPYHATLKSHI